MYERTLSFHVNCFITYFLLFCKSLRLVPIKLDNSQKLLTSSSMFNILMNLKFLEHFQTCFDIYLLQHILLPSSLELWKYSVFLQYQYSDQQCFVVIEIVNLQQLRFSPLSLKSCAQVMQQILEDQTFRISFYISTRETIESTIMQICMAKLMVFMNLPSSYIYCFQLFLLRMGY